LQFIFRLSGQILTRRTLITFQEFDVEALIFRITASIFLGRWSSMMRADEEGDRV
jgi:hypothetical protein